VRSDRAVVRVGMQVAADVVGSGADVDPKSGMKNISLFWTVVGSVAGVIAAGAAVYALFTSGPAPLHLLACCELELEVNSLGGVVSNDNNTFVTFETSSEPVVLTGEVYLKLPLFLDYRVFELGWHKVRLNPSYTYLRNRRIEANSSRRLLSGQVFDVSGFSVRESALPCFSTCPKPIAELSIGVEYRSRQGSSWAYTTVPVCLRRNKYWDVKC
jgi:hypothetical protein